jgi:hypothetical protein
MWAGDALMNVTRDDRLAPRGQPQTPLWYTSSARDKYLVVVGVYTVVS